MRPAPAVRALGSAPAGPGYVSKTDLVATLIRELIITGELAAGEQLRQRDLAQRFRVSQTPVREAMRRLESEGLVRGDTHRGFTVVEPEKAPVGENFQIRDEDGARHISLADREDLVAFARRMAPDGLAQGTSGNLSVRRQGMIAITPSGVPYRG